MNGPRTQMRREQGQGVVEYVLILVFIAFTIFAVMALLGSGIANTILQNIIGAF